MRSSVHRQWERFLMDAARWVNPSEVAPRHELTPKVVILMLVRHLPLRAMLYFRVAGVCKDIRVPALPGLIQRRLLTRFGLELMVGGEIGGGLYIAHPVGCTLVADRIGENVTVIGGVTFGYRGTTGWPTIEDRAFFGTGSCVLGGVTVGADAQIGANAVVLHDVAPRTTVVGVPAKPVAH